MKASFALLLVVSLSSPLLSAAERESLKERRLQQRHSDSPRINQGSLQSKRHQEGKIAQKRLQPTANKPSLSLQYGPHPLQALDVYYPRSCTQRCPVIMMVHGGGWKRGDKQMESVVDHKLQRWGDRAVFVSVNYRLLPTSVGEQAKDVGQAVAFVQKNAHQWRGDGQRVILMGHSAGAHLSALASADPKRFGHRPVLGTVVIDAAALDLTQEVGPLVNSLQREAFGSSNPSERRAVSPAQAIKPGASPYLLICSTQRRDACPQAAALAKAAARQQVPARVLSVPMAHMPLNRDLGKDIPYTWEVEKFLKRVDPNW